MFGLLLLLLFLLLAIPSVAALKCYQGQSTMSAALQGDAAQCATTGSLSCTKSIDWSTQLVVRNCQNVNCTMANGTMSATDTCYNSSSSAQQYCCCYNDGCNWARLGAALSTPMLALLLLLGSAALLWLPGFE